MAAVLNDSEPTARLRQWSNLEVAAVVAVLWGAPTGPHPSIHTTGFPYERQSAVLARRFVRSVLEQWNLGRLVDDALVVVSELVTNAVLHGRSAGTDEADPAIGPITVSTAFRTGVVGLLVEDHNPQAPLARSACPNATTGRGLPLVAALSTAWTCRPTRNGGKGIYAFWRLDDPSFPPSAAPRT